MGNLKTDIHTRLNIKTIDKVTTRPSRWRWVVVLGSFIINIFLGGFSFTLGILYTEIMSRLEASLSDVSWIGSLLIGCTWISAVFTGPLTHIIGYRWIVVIGGFILSLGVLASAFVTSLPLLYITLGVLPGFGLNMAFMGSMIAINMYFTQNRSLAVSLALVGISVGSIVFSSSVQFLLQTFDYQWTLIILSSLCLNTVACGCLYFPLKPSIGTIEIERKSICKMISGSFDLSVFKNFFFVLFMLSNILTNVGLYIPTSFLPEHVISAGYSLEDSSFLFLVYGSSGVVGRALTGPLSERFWNRRLIMCVMGIVLCFVSVLILAFSRQIGMFILFATMYGPFSGIFIILYTILVVDLFGFDKLPTTMALMTLGQGVGGVIGAPIAGILSDVSGMSEAKFIFSSISLLLGALVLLPIFKDKSDPHRKLKEMYFDVSRTVEGEMDIRLFIINFDTISIYGAA